MTAPFIQPNDLILFQGDSITNAFRKPEEVCNAYQMGSGYAMMVAAQLLATRPHDNLRFLNRGVSGHGINELRARWQSDCLDLQPNVLSILVGINDCNPLHPQPALSAAAYETAYRELLAVTRSALPAVRLILCEPFVLLAGQVPAGWLPLVTERGEIVRRLAEEHDARFVPLQAAFAKALKSAPPEYWSFDGIHPNAQGHWLITETWLRHAG